MRRYLLIFIALGLLPAACTTPAGQMARWSNQQGGIIDDRRTERVRALGNTLCDATGCRRPTFDLLRNPTPGAFSWGPAKTPTGEPLQQQPTGHVFITTGLVDDATDAQIQAAIAHELGHLLSDGKTKTAVSLRGLEMSADIERRADAIGCQLLLAAHQSPAALIDALEQVCAASNNSACRREIRERIAIIRQAWLAPPPAASDHN